MGERETKALWRRRKRKARRKVKEEGKRRHRKRKRNWYMKRRDRRKEGRDKQKGRGYKTVKRGKEEGKRGRKKEDMEMREMGGRRGEEGEGLWGQQGKGVVEGRGKTDKWGKQEDGEEIRGRWREKDDGGRPKRDDSLGSEERDRGGREFECPKGDTQSLSDRLRGRERKERRDDFCVLQSFLSSQVQPQCPHGFSWPRGPGDLRALAPVCGFCPGVLNIRFSGFLFLWA